MLIDDVADIGLATEALTAHDEPVTLPCYEWQHARWWCRRPSAGRGGAHHAGPAGREPLVTPTTTFSGRTRIDQAFAARKLKPNIVRWRRSTPT